jgi:hypothetical protein
LNHITDVKRAMVIGHVLAACDTQYFHMRIVLKIREQLWRNEEILGSMLFACNLDHAFVYHALVAGIHALIDLIDDAEGCSCKGLERHKVEDGRDGAFTA